MMAERRLAHRTADSPRGRRATPVSVQAVSVLDPGAELHPAASSRRLTGVCTDAELLADHDEGESSGVELNDLINLAGGRHRLIRTQDNASAERVGAARLPMDVVLVAECGQVESSPVISDQCVDLVRSQLGVRLLSSTTVDQPNDCGRGDVVKAGAAAARSQHVACDRRVGDPAIAVSAGSKRAAMAHLCGQVSAQ